MLPAWPLHCRNIVDLYFIRAQNSLSDKNFVLSLSPIGIEGDVSGSIKPVANQCIPHKLKLLCVFSSFFRHVVCNVLSLVTETQGTELRQFSKIPQDVPSD